MILVLVDVEARGKSPFSGEMTEFGAVALNRDVTAVRDTFHGKLIEATPDPENPAIPFIAAGAKRYDTHKVMSNFRKWLLQLGDRVVFVSDNNGYDYGWLNYYFDKAGLDNPFGHSSRRIGDFAAGLKGDYFNTSKWKKLRDTRHSHHPVEDSLGNAEAVIKLVAMSRGDLPITY